jgi:hypothetical protein
MTNGLGIGAVKQAIQQFYLPGYEKAKPNAQLGFHRVLAA